MHGYHGVLMAGMAAGMLTLSAAAETNAPPPAAASPSRDCSMAMHPRRCEARQQAMQACKDKAAGAERRACIKDKLAVRPQPKL